MTSIYLTDAARNRRLRDEALSLARRAWGKQREFLIFAARRHGHLAIQYRRFARGEL